MWQRQGITQDPERLLFQLGLQRYEIFSYLQVFSQKNQKKQSKYPDIITSFGQTGLEWRFIRRELCLPDKAYSDGHKKKDGPKTVLNSISKSDYSATTSNLAVPLMSL